MEKIKIDLGNYGGPVYNGRSRGEVISNDAKMLLNNYDNVRFLVLIPDETKALTPSFAGGLICKAVQRLGSRDKFLEHFEFRYPTDPVKNGIFKAVIDREISRALFIKKPLLG